MLGTKSLEETISPVEEETPVYSNKRKVIYIRLPSAVAARLEHQRQRLGCTMNALAAMSIVRFLELEEASERGTGGGNNAM